MSAVTILQGDCRQTLATLPAESVQCCVTSPPYYGLRDYGTGSWEGGAPGCEHVRQKRGDASTIDGGHFQSREIYRETCGLCGAVRTDQQIGLEQTPEAYVAELVAVFREVSRVLRTNGVLFLNLGDSYASTASYNAPRKSGHSFDAISSPRQPNAGIPTGLKPKDLIGIPWMVAFALRTDGWYLRQDIVWAKPNPMPESVNDRCTKSHEHLFLLSKSERYYFDADAIKEPIAATSVARLSQDLEQQRGSDRVPGKTNGPMKAVGGSHRPQLVRAREKAAAAGLTQIHFDAIRACGLGDAGKNATTQTGTGKNDPAVQALADHAKSVLGGYYREFLLSDRRNKRDVWTVEEDEWEQFQRWKAEHASDTKDVWTVATKPYKGAHFATFPPDLIRPCILAGSRGGDTILDPFGGSGTTGQVALEEGRRAVLCELNANYLGLIHERCDITPGFAFAESEVAA